MLKLFIYWGLFALVAVGIVVTLIRNRARRNIELAYARERSEKLAAQNANPLPNQSKAAKASPAARSARPAASSSAAAPAAAPAAATPPVAHQDTATSRTEKAASEEPPAFDPNATRVYFGASSGSSTSGVSSVETERNETILTSASSARLICVGGHLKGKSFPLSVDGITIGRDPGNLIAIADPRVSSHHAWVGIVDSKAVLRDLGSTNGTFLNAHMGSQVEEVVLSPGDTIFFGGHGGDQFRFVVD
ncbi:MAG: FHA domain-containing protein [Sulfuritalea sp.]|nr:FHA domain-containing protein [Sulfuritalea sp.]